MQCVKRFLKPIKRLNCLAYVIFSEEVAHYDLFDSCLVLFVFYLELMVNIMVHHRSLLLHL